MWEFDEDFQNRERLKGKELKKSRWWQNLIQNTSCYYCQKSICRNEVTMDHIVPISRGGRSTAGNLVPACKPCNEQKRSLTAVEWQDFLEGFKGPQIDTDSLSTPVGQEKPQAGHSETIEVQA